MPAEQPARSVHATWLYTLGSIVFFIGFLDVVVALTMLETYLATRDPLTLWLIVLVVIASAVQLRYCWFLGAGRGGGLPHPGWTTALLVPAASVWLLGLFAPGNELAAAVPLWAAACVVACLLPKPRRRLLLLGSAVLAIVHPTLTAWATGEPFSLASSSNPWMLGIFSAMLPLMLLSSLWWWDVVVQLDRNRRTAAELAVTQERLRFASDLHDIQGHHLQVISLKAELAERLLEVDPAAAREHIHETRLIAKQALEETRSLVAGYRHVAFDDELENAREVLTASGAACELRVGTLPTDAAAQSALASVVREATTNILRHSEATAVSITLSSADGVASLSVVNDGVADAAAPVQSDRPGAGGAAVAVTRSGSGLAGLRERLAAVGGLLETSTDAAAGRFELRATVPVGERVAA
ncbi:two-component system sensor histidine kinase DesK [Agromyces terreus]|uniref:Two-component system sensor histidine kinase DesK n=1 Tax=Agromyces terreus TaxID=424795 RepID=A0A9X2H0G1_9MICO|nr:histidine kinase [Agromyces terreus]MCP2370911.1 two-component system sensor histidine kinase DesK [Agromyces terreus]